MSYLQEQIDSASDSKLQIVRTGPMWASVYVVSDAGGYAGMQFSQHPIFTGPFADAQRFVADYEEGDPMARFVMEGGAE